MSNIKVSVIVPVYNVEKYLKKCLNSLIDQTFEDYEIIIVNDGSPDNSQKIIDEYVEKYPDKVKGYKKKNGGISSTRNYGLEKSNGKYVIFVDSDDYVTSKYIKTLYEKAISGDYDIVICDAIKKFDNREEFLKGMIGKNKDIVKDAIISIPATWNKIYKKVLFTENNIYYPNGINYAEDLATTLRLLLLAKKIGYVNKTLYYYVQRENSIMNQTKYNPKNNDIFISLNIISNYFKDNNIYNRYRDEIEFIYITHVLHDFSLRVYRYKEGIENIKSAIEIIKNNYPKWRNNKYYKQETLKYKIVCNLIYYNKIYILRKLLK